MVVGRRTADRLPATRSLPADVLPCL